MNPSSSMSHHQGLLFLWESTDSPQDRVPRGNKGLPRLFFADSILLFTWRQWGQISNPLLRTVSYLSVSTFIYLLNVYRAHSVETDICQRTLWGKSILLLACGVQGLNSLSHQFFPSIMWISGTEFTESSSSSSSTLTHLPSHWPLFLCVRKWP